MEVLDFRSHPNGLQSSTFWQYYQTRVIGVELEHPNTRSIDRREPKPKQNKLRYYKTSPLRSSTRRGVNEGLFHCNIKSEFSDRPGKKTEIQLSPDYVFSMNILITQWARAKLRMYDDSSSEHIMELDADIWSWWYGWVGAKRCTFYPCLTMKLHIEREIPKCAIFFTLSPLVSCFN